MARELPPTARIESLARDLYLAMAVSAKDRGKTPGCVASEAFELAETFEAVAARKRQPPEQTET